MNVVAWIITLSGIVFGIIIPFFMPQIIDLYLVDFGSVLKISDLPMSVQSVFAVLF